MRKRKPKIFKVLVFRTNRAGKTKSYFRKPTAKDRELLRKGYCLAGEWDL